MRFLFIYFGRAGSSPLRGLSLVQRAGATRTVALGLLTAVASRCRAQDLERAGFSSCGAWPHVLRGMRDPSIPGTELVSPALEGRSLSTVPPGRSGIVHFFMLREFLFVFLHSPRQTSALKPPFLFCSKLSHFSRIFLRWGLW